MIIECDDVKNSEVMMRDKICCASFCKSLVGAPWVTQFLSVITSDAITWATMTCSRRERERERTMRLMTAVSGIIRAYIN